LNEDRKFDIIKNELKKLKENYKNSKENVFINEINKNINDLREQEKICNINIIEIKNKILNLEKIIHIFSEKGIKKDIIKTSIDPINKYLSNYLIQLESKYNVKLDDNFDAIIKERGINEIHVESLSTGEARKINIAISLSYMEMIININKKTNILFLDEVFASVDFSNIDLMLKVMRDFSIRNKMNIIIVNHTHFDNTKFDRILNIEKINGFSFLKEN
jgi:DNA repair exonuclease SbcCD ATPase subunit